MAFNFTRAAFLDNALEDLFVVIENSLVSGRFWLPRQQEIEIRRGGTWLDYPVRGIIRGRWEIGDYQVNIGLRSRDVRRSGDRPRAEGGAGHLPLRRPHPRLAAARRARRHRRRHPQRAGGGARARARAGAPSPAGAHALRRRRLRLRRASIAPRDSPSAPASRRASAAGSASQARGRYGIDDQRGEGQRHARVAVAARGAFACSASATSATPATSRSVRGVVNSLAAQEFGSDYTDPYGVHGGGIRLRRARRCSGFRCISTPRSSASARSRCAPCRRRACSSAILPAAPLRALRFSLAADRPTALSFLGTERRASTASFV